MKLYEPLPLFPKTYDQLDELVRIKKERGESAANPVMVVASLINMELLKENKSEKSNENRD